jgi:hypothetical protein
MSGQNHMLALQREAKSILESLYLSYGNRRNLYTGGNTARRGMGTAPGQILNGRRHGEYGVLKSVYVYVCMCVCMYVCMYVQLRAK